MSGLQTAGMRPVSEDDALECGENTNLVFHILLGFKMTFVYLIYCA